MSMLTEQTIEKLTNLGLFEMARAISEQVKNPRVVALDFDERLGLMVDLEWMARQQRRLDKRLKSAQLKQRACLEELDFQHPRGLDRKVMVHLASCAWIRNHQNVIITGATGLGKSWVACALADNACRNGFTAIYKQVQRLTFELALARADGTYLKVLSQLCKADVLVLDDWGLFRLEGQAQNDIFDVIDDRHGKSTVVTSQIPVSKWHSTVGDPTVADALLDRIIHSATEIKFRNSPTMRPPKGADAATKKAKVDQ